MPASAAHKLTTYIANLARLSLADLAQQHLMVGEELLETEDTASALVQRAILKVIDAIGSARFPREWTQARDGAGVRQDVV